MLTRWFFVALLLLVSPASAAAQEPYLVAYAGFAFELAIIYVVMLQSMLDTAGFFLAAAVLLGILALVIMRVEKRMKATSAAWSGR